ncbi:iron-sulfur cluster assembly accessory protein, partial [Staphylococcus epidermidis]|uniref:HesB/IscA family protein n=2 Tax=Staphylococcus TaxID=1279 RepID=UPI0030BB059E
MSTVTLTEAAAYEVKDMLKSNDMADGYLKIKVNGGGCTGLTYGMSAEEQPGENDEVLEFYGLKVLVDKYDVPVLNGTTIDFKQSL